MKERIISIFDKYGIKIDEKQANQFVLYYNFLVEENKKYNLTAITEENEVCFKHFLDSVLAVSLLDKNASVIDVGTGAGFPGIPIKIVRPDLQVTLLDSLQKRVNFLNQVIDLLKLEKITAIHARVEDFAVKNREKFDFSLSRAVASTNTLSEYLIPLVKIGGKIIMYKSNKLDDELKISQNAITLLGGKIQEIKSFEIKEESATRKLLIINKIKNTPIKYPRGKNLPKTNPLI